MKYKQRVWDWLEIGPSTGDWPHRGGARMWAKRGAAGLLVLLVLSALFGNDDSKTITRTVTQTVAAAPANPPAEVADVQPTRRDVARAARVQGLDKAIALATAIGADDLRARYQSRAARRLERSARRALNSGAYNSAQRLARTARVRYGIAAAAAPAIRAQATQLLSAQRAAIRARRAAARAQRAARRAARRQAEQAQALKLQNSPDTTSSDGGSYAGMTCPEIGHSFTVTPGSDPEHDRDNDGIACESQ